MRLTGTTGCALVLGLLTALCLAGSASAGSSLPVGVCTAGQPPANCVTVTATAAGGAPPGVTLVYMRQFPYEQGVESGSYLLEVQNNVGTGYLRSFTYTPPAGMVITAVKSETRITAPGQRVYARFAAPPIVEIPVDPDVGAKGSVDRGATNHGQAECALASGRLACVLTNPGVQRSNGRRTTWTYAVGLAMSGTPQGIESRCSFSCGYGSLPLQIPGVAPVPGRIPSFDSGTSPLDGDIPLCKKATKTTKAQVSTKEHPCQT